MGVGFCGNPRVSRMTKTYVPRELFIIISMPLFSNFPFLKIERKYNSECEFSVIGTICTFPFSAAAEQLDILSWITTFVKVLDNLNEFSISSKKNLHFYTDRYYCDSDSDNSNQ